MRLILIKIFFICFFCLSLQGCETLGGLFSDDSEHANNADDEYGGWNSEKFRAEAKKAVDSGNYDKAIKLYEALESRFPFGDTAAQTQLDIAYAYYKNNDAESALAAADRFIKINPRNPHVDYAYYLKGLVNYNRDIGFIDRFLPTDTSQRDPGSASNAYNNFEDLLKRFPGSQYTADAKLRMVALKNNLAMHEVHVARYYLKRQAYIAAANRASGVVDNYQKTPAVPFALQVMQEAYTQLGMNELADDAKRVYDLNFPEGPPVPEQKNSTLSHRFWDLIGLEK
ncbi:MAG: outer membrane protein assembly factor BamD [Methylovulum sp.]|jgi:outer membrane protein assembly factor BamD|nr:outer membrane protein assembly factor BamD [Methylovulum sp.]MCF7997943.1 outer membrane protein assembly factor BamD [Methylovulum sp.]